MTVPAEDPPSRGPGRPRAEPRADQHERIVAAARVAFTERGYDAVTLSSIAEDARVGRAVVYEVVGSKEHLLGAVADQVAAEIVAAVDERFARGSLDHPRGRPFEEQVRDDVQWFFELIRDEPSYAPIIRLSGHLASQPDDPGTRARRRIEDRITELHVARGRALGVERGPSARALSVVTLALLEAVSVRATEEPWPVDELAALVAEYATGGYLRAEDEGAAQAFEERMRDLDP